MPKKTISLTMLVENTAFRKDLRTEHGLSAWLETPEGDVLWDTGQSPLVLENAWKMGVEIENASFIALSHGHYDHTGGLAAILAANQSVRVFGHPGIFRRRYAMSQGGGREARPIGSPITRGTVRAKCAALELSARPAEVIPGVFLTGEIPRVTECEDTGGDFFLDKYLALRDPIPDDQALYFDTARGIVVLLGCAHSGVINTLDHIAKLTEREQIYGVFGGMHLLNASDERLAETSGALVKYDVQMIGPCHCTGERAKTLFRSLFPERMAECATGARFGFTI